MASLIAVLPNHVLRGSMAKFLLLSDMSRLQVADVATKSSLDEVGIWLESARVALPEFSLSEELFKGGARGSFLMMLRVFRSTAVSRMDQVPLPSLAAATKLSKLLANANKAAAMHVARGGGSAQVFIARLMFKRETIAAVFEEGASEDTTGQAPALCLGATVVVPGGPKQQRAAKRLHFAWRGGSLLVSARSDGARTVDIDLPEEHLYLGAVEGDGTGAAVTVDVTSCSTALTLSYRGVAVPTDARWQAASNGICAHTRGRAAAVEALAQGVLCVICLRDGMPEAVSNLAKTLHLDTPHR